MVEIDLRPPPVLLLFLLSLALSTVHAAGGTFNCASSYEVHQALERVEPGDTILLQGGTIYEIDQSLNLAANGTAEKRITFTSVDDTSAGRYAVISTIGQRKEESLVALKVSGSFWNVSRLEISGHEVPLSDGYWETKGFRIGLYLAGPDSHNNTIEDLHIHHTHNAAIAIRDESHKNTFHRLRIHHIGEWLDEDYNAHEGEGFYIGSSKGRKAGGQKAVVKDIVIEGCELGPRLLGQYVDIKYAASMVTVRNNIFHCSERAYNQEVIKVAGFANRIEGNTFIGSHENLSRYIYILRNRPADSVKVDYRDQHDMLPPSGRDNVVANNHFYPDDASIPAVYEKAEAGDKSTLVIGSNLILPSSSIQDSNN
jgi:hypothetical protein